MTKGPSGGLMVVAVARACAFRCNSFPLEEAASNAGVLSHWRIHHAIRLPGAAGRSLISSVPAAATQLLSCAMASRTACDVALPGLLSCCKYTVSGAEAPAASQAHVDMSMPSGSKLAKNMPFPLAFLQGSAALPPGPPVAAAARAVAGAAGGGI